MRTYIRLKYQLAGKLPAEFRDEELRYPRELVAVFVQRYTSPGQVVLDPFAGYGTTLDVAESLGREAYGIEIDPRRVAFVRERLAVPDRIVHGDAQHVGEYGLPPAHLVICAPPFMAFHERENVLRGTSSDDAYAEYLSDLATIFEHVMRQLVPDGYVVIEVSNLKDEQGTTPLAWDVARVVGAVLRFEEEIIVLWDRPHYGYDHSYCLVFRRR